MMIESVVAPNFCSATARIAMLGHDEEQVGDAHEHLVDPLAEVAGDRADDRADDGREDRDREADLQRDLAARTALR